MSTSRRLILFIFLLAVLILLGVVFAPFVLSQIIQPFALVIWLLLRLFVLSIDQKYYWGLLIAAGAFFAIRRLILSLEADRPAGQSGAVTALSADKWRSDIHYAASDIQERSAFKRELTRMFISLYTSRQQGAAYSEIHEALEQRQIPLPEGVYSFLFPHPPQETGRPAILRWIRTIRRAPRTWIRQWTGQEAREYYQAVEEVLSFLENALEIKNDDRPSDSSDR